jgi:short-subunit dehydrogenase
MIEMNGENLAQMKMNSKKNILITGCGSGLGKTFFESRKKYNHNVYPHLRKNSVSEVSSLVGDITDSDFLNKFNLFLEENQINVFINNAAIYRNKSVLDFSNEEISDIINVNLTQQILLLKETYKFFKSKNEGLIININSIAGKFPSANESVYASTKSGLYAFSKSLQLESLNDKIEIIDVFLGGMKTKITENRKNYDSLMDTGEVSDLIYELVSNNKNIFINEIVVRKKK